MFIEHVNLTVTDIESSIEFYRSLFGWQVRWKGRTTGGRPAVHVGDERCYVALFEAAGPGKAPSDYERVGFNHFGVVVDDIDGMKKKLEALGVQHGDEQDYEPGRRVYFVDHDNIEIELVQYERAAV